MADSLISARIGADGFIQDYEDLLYNPHNDIGERFGSVYEDVVFDILDSASRLYLLLNENNEHGMHPRCERRMVDLMHLCANILDFHAKGIMCVGRGKTFNGEI